MTIFRIVWAIDVIVALIFVLFFFVGIADGSVSSFNIVLWLAVLGALAAVLLGSRALADRGHRAIAVALAAVPAVPALLYGLIIAVAILTGARWN